MNKAANEGARRNRHNVDLSELGAHEWITGKSYRRLRLMEAKMHRTAEAYCNGEIDEQELERVEQRITTGVASVFNGKLPKGFEINQDPRGYALKINDEVMRQYYEANGHEMINYRDWGGYGILAPDFN